MFMHLMRFRIKNLYKRNFVLKGFQKSLWLIAISASCWTMWLARNG
ncbi:hypothetical protein Goarm_014539, partial [Gossypium armourianum]|nr:hypothetical protein [Gossypium armourianum]